MKSELYDRELIKNNLKKREAKDKMLKTVTLIATGIGIFFLIALLVQIFSNGLKNLNWEFITNFPSSRPLKAGIAPAIVGSIYILVLTAVISIPFGIGTAIYLELYAKPSKITNFIKLNIQNLAGVPAIVYGILGLGVFVKLFMFGSSILSGALTLSLLVLSPIIISSQEAFRAVPYSFYEGALALGVSKWKAIRGVVLPCALSNIVTGIVLSLARAIGEASPLIVVGAATFIRFIPVSLFDGFTVLPIQIYNWTSRPEIEFQYLASSGIIILLLIVLAFNIVAIIIRKKFEKKYD
ncbi:phosphate ABC transporter, inner membrane subunit PstA [Candidatus Arthromitus sp. SFB-mouse-Japan]|uniref:phosphate ABC transporter permease PstA n=1 Tax=Candidatus Arthromitus sp. SFB-mouse TaxID=49118 RepID=UPI00021B7D06|nr:phosphate ABC transporter permease PstA [Candidatus Arthromitus sp. SFB-mouse]EIA24607.1 Phosphate ABC transporter, inner membrane subunit PstA [Candidatus Arthromitus sp. SFB-1]EIA27430.1 Phosphate ABC transporter, inner membrane subunit PstA [Candidatus Arthromitus sp. SFB-co]EIA27497.1 Phosphate ABC transporter, inner membrane subunit PstA [Candidatus Arthromitus sp. SFB-5]EIA28676.1 Phosphate ABC transporter, inner membrane subunit PstA [Candidatus Arthromitus sp. SFB-4]EIA30856.1 Phosp